MVPTRTNELSPTAIEAPSSGMIDVASARQAQEVQAAMVVAKRFPRDENRAFDRIMRACKRKSLAEVACYAYPRGGTTVTGPSIRLAESLAQNWGNLDFGVVELEQRDGESVVMSYAWDLETNTRQTKTFTVAHERHVGRGEKKEAVRLTDPRDIYEMVANQGARRVRSCILGVIPGDIVDAAVAECEKTLATGSSNEPLLNRVRKMVAVFSEFGVTSSMIETRLGHKLEATGEQELANLRKIFMSLRDGMSKREDFFDLPKTAEPAKPQPKPSDDEKAEAAMGLAPEQPTSQPTSAPAPTSAPTVRKPQDLLADLVGGEGYTFDQLIIWGRETGNIEGEFGSYDELSDALCKRLVKAKAGLLRGLALMREGGAQ